MSIGRRGLTDGLATLLSELEAGRDQLAHTLVCRD